LRGEIFQDVERCMPDNVYFRQPATQKMLLDTLFIYCKLNQDVGYRQGMHEILAPILWVIESDALDPTQLQPLGDRLFSQMLDAHYIEHDTFTLFGLIMQNAKSFYAPAVAEAAKSDPATANDSPMIQRSKRIYNVYLPRADPALYSHLVKQEIVPQIFLM
jgi:TBC1 domain family member 5